MPRMATTGDWSSGSGKGKERDRDRERSVWGWVADGLSLPAVLGGRSAREREKDRERDLEREREKDNQFDHEELDANERSPPIGRTLSRSRSRSRAQRRIRQLGGTATGVFRALWRARNGVVLLSGREALAVAWPAGVVWVLVNGLFFLS